MLLTDNSLLRQGRLSRSLKYMKSSKVATEIGHQIFCDKTLHNKDISWYYLINEEVGLIDRFRLPYMKRKTERTLAEHQRHYLSIAY